MVKQCLVFHIRGYYSAVKRNNPWKHSHMGEFPEDYAE
jgi:hypothetical protein